ncbi:MAG TPA: VOC family protein [Streptosporangiales bacterium]
MAIARFKDLCMDAADPLVLGSFWSAALDLELQRRDDGDVRLVGPTDGHTIWIDRVPEPRTVKHRVHLDIYTTALAELERLGASFVADDDAWRWTIMADPEGGEFCAFLRDELPRDRLHGIVIDSADPIAQGRWWADVFGAKLDTHDDNDGVWATLEEVPGMPILTMDFNAVPEPKVGKNRVHWDVTVDDVAALVEAGATVRRTPDDEVRWHVLTDPEGNEFCAFTP